MNEEAKKRIQELLREGLQHSENGDYPEAVQSWRQALELDPDNQQLLKFIEIAKRKLDQKTEDLPGRPTPPVRRPNVAPSGATFDLAEREQVIPLEKIERAQKTERIINPQQPTLPRAADKGYNLRRPRGKRFSIPYAVHVLHLAFGLSVLIIGMTSLRFVRQSFYHREFRAGVTYFAEENYLRAIRELKTTIKINSGSRWAKLFLIGALSKLEYFEEALAQADDYQRRFGTDRHLESLRYSICSAAGKTESIAGSLQSVLTLSSYDQRFLLIYAQQLVDEGRYREVDDLLLPVVDENPLLLDAYRLLFHTHLRLGQTAVAQSWLEIALKHNPTVPDFYVLLAESYLQQNAKDRARILLKKARKIPSSSVEHHVALARLSQKLDLIEDAMAEYDLAFVLEDDPALILVEKSNLLLELKRTVEAEKILRSGLELDSESQELNAKLATLYFKTDRPRNAIFHYEAAAEKVQQDSKLLSELAECYAAVGRKVEAEAALNKALTIDPDLKRDTKNRK